MRTGATTLDTSQATGEEAIERQTKNLNLRTSLSHGLDADGSFTVRLPQAKRDHLHLLVDDATGLPRGVRTMAVHQAG
ncbi:MAG TPA: hypothetical protein PKJ32_01150 [Piscinibacter sp.]|nr:hypothetical protein [Piscinibacter sp.]HOY36481.1 hypothetical protein [Piscinibacter sp.]